MTRRRRNSLKKNRFCPPVAHSILVALQTVNPSRPSTCCKV
nr:MAG TPA: hypothetical protein [Caudoviricetes sp.]